MNYLFFDTETASVPDDPSIGPDEDILVQLAYIILTDDKEFILKERLCNNAGCCITPRASEFNRITNEDIDDLLPIQEYEEYHFLKNFIENNECTAVAHNAPFDIEVLRRVGIDIKKHCKVIDTLRVSKVINDFLGLPLEYNTLQFLKYHFGLYNTRKSFDALHGTKDTAHEALSDCVDLLFYFKHLKQEQKAPDDVLIQLSIGPNKLKYIPFGSNKGKEFSELSYNSLKWYSELTDPDISYTAKSHM